MPLIVSWQLSHQLVFKKKNDFQNWLVFILTKQHLWYILFYFKTGENARKICSVYKEASVYDCQKRFCKILCWIVLNKQRDKLGFNIKFWHDLIRIDIIWKVTSVLKISKSSTENLLQVGYVSLIDVSLINVWLPHCNH